ncbi:MAG: hypothetical protein JOZ02_05400 [Acidobacteria bacterium]|nr:hypothetical protein [Acidobacteriota bacterium]
MSARRKAHHYVLNRFAVRSVCLFIATLLVSCQGSYELTTKFSPNQLRDDLRVLRRSLEQAQPGLYRRTSKEELDRLFSEADKSLERPLDVFEFYRAIAPLVAAVRCGHTNLQPPDFFVREQDTPRVKSFPALVKIIDGRIYIWRDLGDKNSRLGGKEVIAINNVPAAQIISAMLGATGGDGDIQTSRVERIEGWNFIKKLLPLTGLQPPFDLTVSGAADGLQERIRLDGLDIPTLGRNWETWFPRDRRPSASAGLEFLDGGRIARLTVREFGGFVDDKRQRGLAEFYQDAFRQLAAAGTETLILDLRDNNGGDDKLGALLLRHLLNEPFTYFEEVVARGTYFALGEGLFGTNRIRLPYQTEKRGDGLYRLTDYPNFGLLQPSAPTFSGQIYVLMNGGSFSTTAEVISQLHYHRRAQFIGAEDGGAYDGNNSGTIAAVTLPHTKLVLTVPLMSFYLPVGGSEDGSRGVRPDYPVDYSVGDYLINSDKELALALKLARHE